MSTYSRRLYHIVFATKGRAPSLCAEHRRELFAYLHGVMKNLDCHLYRMNGVNDHVHILVDLHASISVADFVRTLKTSSTSWMRNSGLFPQFRNWQEGYGAFTVSWADRDRVIEYIKNQEAHHATEATLDELMRLATEAGLEWDERHPP